MTAFSSIGLKQSAWQTTVLVSLGFWLSGSLLLDWVVIPSLYGAGMMSQSGFATASYSVFWIFNRIELLCAALVLTGLLVLRNTQNISRPVGSKVVILSLLLLTIALIYTYVLTPQMSSLGMQLNLFEPTARIQAGMTQMHEGYWLLEAIKLILGGTLLGWCLRQQGARKEM